VQFMRQPSRCKVHAAQANSRSTRTRSEGSLARHLAGSPSPSSRVMGFSATSRQPVLGHYLPNRAPRAGACQPSSTLGKSINKQVIELALSISRAVLGINNRIVSRVRSGWARAPGRPKPGIFGTLSSEQVMGCNRLVAAGVMIIALCGGGDVLLRQHWLAPVLVWTGAAVGMFVWAGAGRRQANLRRIVGMALDVYGATTMLIAGGSETAFLYAVYLWVIIGYGFRFGVNYLVATSVSSIIGFALVIWIDPFWNSHLSLSFGLLAGLGVLPAYSYGLMRQLAKARRRAERADRAKSLFLASVSHELRTPLHAIIGTAEALRGTTLDSNQFSMVETINTAADGQLSLVRDLLEFARTNGEEIGKTLERFDLVELLGKVISIAAVEGGRKGLLVGSHITARTPLRLFGDERRIREVLLNLSTNATKFTGYGSVTISADGIIDNKGMVTLHLEVMDTGVGIAPEHLGKIFDPFTQADESIFNRFGGTGLGLALCQQQVNAMGGEIQVESTPGAGSTFRVTLPLQASAEAELVPAPSRILVVATSAAEASAVRHGMEAIPRLRENGVELIVSLGQHPANQNQADAMIHVSASPVDGLPSREIREHYATSVNAQSNGVELQRAVRIASLQSARVRAVAKRQDVDTLIAPADNLKGCRVLVADDNTVNRSLVSRMLSSAGAVVILAGDGEEALAILSEGNVDLGLLDVNMPKLNGIEAAQLFQLAAAGSQRIPLVALTADASTDTQAQCLQAGMAACLVKPIRTAALLESLNGVLGIHKGESTSRPPSPSVSIPRLDTRLLDELENLGDHEFLKQLVADWKRDSLASLTSLTVAVASQDVHCFRFEAHSISSAAANLGARALQQMCSPLSRITEEDFRSDGMQLITDLRLEWDRTALDFDRRLTAGAGHGVGTGSQRLTI